MTTLSSARLSAAAALLQTYCQLAQPEAEALVISWSQGYPSEWVYPAVIEALYQGRYKPVSVEQLLRFWQRRGRSLPRFSGEFESLVRVGSSVAADLASRPQIPRSPDTPPTVPIPDLSQQPLFPTSWVMGSANNPWAIAPFVPAEDPTGFTRRLQTVLAGKG
jgi:hypothetical protein